MPELSLQEVWKACSKLRAAIFRNGLEFKVLFQDMDQHGTGLVSDAQFSISMNWARESAGLTSAEICAIADYFRVPDGRILYGQLVEVVTGSVPSFDENPPITSGMELRDPLKCNSLGPTEERRVHILLARIASRVAQRRLLVLPYFQDYELVSRNQGTVTINHFGRVLNFLRIRLSTEEFRLLCKKFMVDSYCVNYVAFIQSIHDKNEMFSETGCLDQSKDFVPPYLGLAGGAMLNKLPGTSPAGNPWVNSERGLHYLMRDPVVDISLLLCRIQQFVFRYRIRVCVFFQDFDPRRCGLITETQFRRGLDALGASALDKLPLSAAEAAALCDIYRDPEQPSMIRWTDFDCQVEKVFTRRMLHRLPGIQPANEEPCVRLLEKGTKAWRYVPESTRDIFDIAISKLRDRINKRWIELRPFFLSFDKKRTGRVSSTQMRRCFAMAALFPTDVEVHAIEERCMDDMGFNYRRFMDELNPQIPGEDLFQRFLPQLKAVNRRCLSSPKICEYELQRVLEKIWTKVVRERIRVLDFLKDWDTFNTGRISGQNFRRGVDLTGLNLSPTEVCTLHEAFQSAVNPREVEYRAFVDVVESAFTLPEMTKAPTVVPIQKIPAHGSDRNCLNEEERLAVSKALDRLAAHLRQSRSEPRQVFGQLDLEKRGHLTESRFKNGLKETGLDKVVSKEEADLIARCFRVSCAGDFVDYRTFCNALDVLIYATIKKPVY